jgi:3-oxoacyl-[acyl-carrier-protein] synthase II
MAAYFKGAAVLSPQKTFVKPGFPEEISFYEQVDWLKCIEPIYRDYIDPMVARRMSRIVKMGVCSALKCLRDTGIEIPDAIITGTGLGCLEDTEKFLGSIYTNEEKLLNPTPFIHSTHNTVSGAIALAIKCHGYNATYTHRGFSFESALQDALLQIKENPGLNILAGSFDELTPNSYTITKRLGLWKNHPVNNQDLLKYNTRGSLPGEGVAFFMLSGEPGHLDLAQLRSVETFYKPSGYSDVAHNIDSFLQSEGLKTEDIDLVLMGFNGDPTTDRIYHVLMQDKFKGLPVAWYKHLCGEYDTASSFALWLGSLVLKNQEVPACMVLNNPKHSGIQHVLVYNHIRGINHALFLLERC